MRDPKRIKPFVKKLGEYWERDVPDWRFGQLMSNFMGFAWQQENRDIFFTEDDVMSHLLDKFFREMVNGGDDVNTDNEQKSNAT